MKWLRKIGLTTVILSFLAPVALFAQSSESTQEDVAKSLVRYGQSQALCNQDREALIQFFQRQMKELTDALAKARLDASKPETKPHAD